MFVLAVVGTYTKCVLSVYIRRVWYPLQKQLLAVQQELVLRLQRLDYTATIRLYSAVYSRYYNELKKRHWSYLCCEMVVCDKQSVRKYFVQYISVLVGKYPSEHPLVRFAT